MFKYMSCENIRGNRQAIRKLWPRKSRQKLNVTLTDVALNLTKPHVNKVKRIQIKLRKVEVTIPLPYLVYVRKNLT